MPVWYRSFDGTCAVNLSHVRELRIQENESAVAEDNADSHAVCAITLRLHEDEAVELYIGTEHQCEVFLERICHEQSRPEAL